MANKRFYQDFAAKPSVKPADKLMVGDGATGLSYAATVDDIAKGMPPSQKLTGLTFDSGQVTANDTVLSSIGKMVSNLARSDDKIKATDDLLSEVLIMEEGSGGSLNLWDGSSILGYIEPADGGFIEDASDPLMFATNLIPVKGNCYYSISHLRIFMALSQCLDVNKANPMRLIPRNGGLWDTFGTPNATGDDAASNQDAVVKTPANARYIQIQLSTNIEDGNPVPKVMFEEVGLVDDPSFVPSPYDPAGQLIAKIRPSALPDLTTSNCLLYDKCDDKAIGAWQTTMGTATIITDPKMGLVTQYKRTSGTGKYQYTPPLSVERKSILNKVVTFYVCAKEISTGGEWKCGIEGMSVSTLTSTIFDKKEDLGSGWFLYKKTIVYLKDLAPNNPAPNNTALNNVTGEWLFAYVILCPGG